MDITQGTAERSTILSPTNATFAGLPIQQAEDVRKSRGFLLVIVGPPNNGKTTLIITLTSSARVKRILFVDIEGGAHVLPSNAGFDIVRASSWIALHKIKEQLKKSADPYDAIVFDNFCEAQKMNLAHHHLYEVDDKTKRGIYGKSADELVNFTRDLQIVAEQQHKYVVINAWDEQREDEHTGIKKHGLYLTPALSTYFVGVVDYIGFLTLGAPKPYPPILHFEARTDSVAKFRAAQDSELFNIPRTQYNPNLGHIIDAYNDDKIDWEALHGKART